MLQLREISHKPNSELSNFDATISNYEDSSQKTKDHLSWTNRGWSRPLLYIEQKAKPHTYSMLASMRVG